MLWTNIHKTLDYCRRNGLRATFYAARERLRENAEADYAYEDPSAEELAAEAEAFEAMAEKERLPLVSFLVPVWHPNTAFLREMAESVRAQSYGNWELVIADASGEEETKELLESFADPRIVRVELSENGGISANTNAAAAAAHGDYAALLDYDDLLTPDCLALVTQCILAEEPDIVYTDEDKCDGEAKIFFEPNRKPDFNPDYLLANNYICHLTVMRLSLFLSLQERSEFDGAQDYDLLLRAPWERIAHVPKVCYHWRTHGQSTAANPGSKSYAYDAGLAALNEYFRRRGMNASAVHSMHRGFYSVHYEPSIFACRPEVGAVGGKVTDRRRRIVGGAMEEDGSVLFLGLHERESGPMHRADTAQTVAALDLRSIRVREELADLLSEAEKALERSGDVKKESLALSARIREGGYLLVFDPELLVRA